MARLGPGRIGPGKAVELLGTHVVEPATYRTAVFNRQPVTPGRPRRAGIYAGHVEADHARRHACRNTIFRWVNSTSYRLAIRPIVFKKCPKSVSMRATRKRSSKENCRPSACAFIGF